MLIVLYLVINVLYFKSMLIFDVVVVVIEGLFLTYDLKSLPFNWIRVINF